MSWITSPEDLAEACADAGAALQAIQDHLGQDLSPAGQVRFPRGFLPTAQQGRRRLAFLSTEVLRTNVSYALMLGAVQRWLLHRTDLAATAQEMVVKLGLAIYGSVAEAVLRDATRMTMGSRQRVASRVARLQADGVIEAPLAADLAWLWDRRNRQHLFELTRREINEYRLDDFDRAERAVDALLRALATGASERQV